MSSRINLAGALVVLGALGACSTHKAAAPASIAVHQTTVQRRTMAAYETLDGQVDPFLQAGLAPQQSGTLVAIYANEGDHVRKDAVLAKIDDSILRTNLTQQQGEQGQSVSKLTQSQIQVPITDVSVRSALVEADKTLAQTQKQQIADVANVANTKLTYEADRKLLRQGFVSESGYEQARATYIAAKQTADADADKLAQAEAALREARQNLANSALAREMVVENHAAVEQAEGSVEQYRTAITQTTLNAPFDGVVTSRSLDPGAFASPSQAIFQISQVDPIYVDFNVKDTDLAYVSPGTLVSFATSANPQRRYDGTVASVNAVPTTGTLLYRARIIERNPDFSLRGGLQVSVRITKTVHANVLTVPRAAVDQNSATGIVYEIGSTGEGSNTATVAKQLTVALGLQNDQFVEVSGQSLRAGLPIVLGIVDNLRDGSRISLSNK